ncbi:hypothetical protein COLO4_24396 [Corchorus olitorius]|uniref:Uncharacterized protein n=1 Tax=Corchorus olitorius TaxID=93759 RepID=A0A1R3IAM0_9ROSI|nr:hypothetical protein COLO4_24396 [Corchorus olitorius]
MEVKLHRNAHLHPLIAAPTSVRCEYHQISLDLTLPKLNFTTSIGKSHRHLKPIPRESKEGETWGREQGKRKGNELSFFWFPVE